MKIYISNNNNLRCKYRIIWLDVCNSSFKHHEILSMNKENGNREENLKNNMSGEKEK